MGNKIKSTLLLLRVQLIIVSLLFIDQILGFDDKVQVRDIIDDIGIYIHIASIGEPLI